MRKIENKLFQETYVEETLENGLSILVFHKPLFQTTSCLFATPFGSFDSEQVDDVGNRYSYPKGVAHFLEHKLFESDEGDVMSQFAMLGASVNAYTSYDETSYFFTTPSKEIEAPLNLLLDFVQDLHITEESVTKEKGIIQEERSLYEQDSSSRLNLELYRSMYLNHPLIEDIVGTKESINAMNEQVLKECYSYNYHPSRMMLVCVTPIDPQVVIEIVRKNQALKTFDQPMHLRRDPFVEPNTIQTPFNKIDLNLNESRVGIGFKQVVVNETNKERLLRDWCIKMCLDAFFTSINEDYQEWLDEEWISPYFNSEETFEEDYALIMMYDETEDVDKFKQFVVDKMRECITKGINPQQLEQLKKRALGNFLTIFNSCETLATVAYRAKERGITLFEEFEMVEGISVEMCNAYMQEIDLEQMVVVQLS